MRLYSRFYGLPCTGTQGTLPTSLLSPSQAQWGGPTSNGSGGQQSSWIVGEQPLPLQSLALMPLQGVSQASLHGVPAAIILSFCPHSYAWGARRSLGEPRGGCAWLFHVPLVNESSPVASQQACKGQASSSEDPSQTPRKTAHHPVTGLRGHEDTAKSIQGAARVYASPLWSQLSKSI